VGGEITAQNSRRTKRTGVDHVTTTSEDNVRPLANKLQALVPSKRSFHKSFS